jgi:hypothetical protein
MGDVWNEMVVAEFERQKFRGQADDSHENKQLIQSVHGARCEPETSRVGRRSVATLSTATQGEERKSIKIISHTAR